MNNNERELRFADLGAMILKSIKGIIALTLVFALLGGAFGAGRELRKEKKITVTKNDVKQAEEMLRATQNDLAAAERALDKRLNNEIPDAEKKIERAELQVQRRQQYIDDSIYQSMNPFNHAVSRMIFYVETEMEINPDTPWLGSDPQSSVAIAFTEAYDNDMKILDEVCRIMNTDAEIRYIKELISVTAVSDRFVEIVVYFSDPEIAEKVVDYLYQELSARMKESIDYFSANIISRFTGYEFDWTMSDKQNSNEDELMKAERAQETAYDNLQSLQDGIAEKENRIDELKDLSNQLPYLHWYKWHRQQ